MSMVRTRRALPTSVRTTTDGMAAPVSASTTAVCPAYSPVPRILTRSPMENEPPPFCAVGSIDTTVGRVITASRVAARWLVAVRAGG